MGFYFLALKKTGETKMSAIEKCSVCNCGYIRKNVVVRHNFLWNQTWEFIDCTNSNCEVHKRYVTDTDNFYKDEPNSKGREQK